MDFFLVSFFVIALQALHTQAISQAFSTDTNDNITILNAVAICGDLGVMKVEDHVLPIGVSKTDVRMCAEHPHGRNRTLDPNDGASLAPMVAAAAAAAAAAQEEHVSHPDTSPVSPTGLETLEGRSCNDAAPYGCSRKFCWRSCGDKKKPGKWCWTASKLGLGDWKECETFRDCSGDSTTDACGVCLNLMVCGCSC